MYSITDLHALLPMIVYIPKHEKEGESAAGLWLKLQRLSLDTLG